MVSEGIVIISDPKTYIVESRVSLQSARIREVRLKGRGVLRIILADTSAYHFR